MGSLYYPWADIAADAGLVVRVTDTNKGWERRARSSGGFAAPPLGCMWHHAASSPNMSDESCVNYQVRGNPDNPVGNCTLGRNGDVWPIAGGASNCSGKGGPWTFSRGQCKQDAGNTTLVNFEVNNNGVGEPWSTTLIDAYFALSNAINAHLGNRPDDVVGHQHYAPTRKIDPATAAAVQGAWRPRSLNSSGTWNLDDMRGECQRRATHYPPGPTPEPEPLPDPDLEDDVKLYLVLDPADGQTQWVTDMFSARTRVPEPGVAQEGVQLFGWTAMSGTDPFGLGAGWGPFLDALPITAP
jgi:hypothetical protein